MRCDVVREQLSAYLDGQLPAEEAAHLQAHAGGCARCTAELAALRRLVSGLHELVDVETPDIAAGVRRQLAGSSATRPRVDWSRLRVPHVLGLSAAGLVVVFLAVSSPWGVPRMLESRQQRAERVLAKVPPMPAVPRVPMRVASDAPAAPPALRSASLLERKRALVAFDAQADAQHRRVAGKELAALGDEFSLNKTTPVAGRAIGSMAKLGSDSAPRTSMPQHIAEDMHMKSPVNYGTLSKSINDEMAPSPMLSSPLKSSVDGLPLAQRQTLGMSQAMLSSAASLDGLARVEAAKERGAVEFAMNLDTAASTAPAAPPVTIPALPLRWAVRDYVSAIASLSQWTAAHAPAVAMSIADRTVTIELPSAKYPALVQQLLRLGSVMTESGAAPPTAVTDPSAPRVRLDLLLLVPASSTAPPAAP